MKHIHFFGCSFTAGDELSDEHWFPWKKDVNSAEEYYKKRADSDFDYLKYQEENKAQAYPAILNGINHAVNGMSLKECMLRIVELINSDSKVDAIYLQIPPFLRELYITDDNTVTSLLFNSVDKDLVKSYVQTKILTHSALNFAVNDTLELILFNRFMQSTNVNFSIISFGYELMLRINELQNSPFNFLIKELQKVEVIDFFNYAGTESTKIRSLGGHFTLEAHNYFAKAIKQHLADKFSILLD